MGIGNSFQRISSKIFAVIFVIVAGSTLALYFYGGTLSRFIRESRMRRIASTHYEILFPESDSSAEAMTQFATQRETLFATIERNLGNAAADTKIRIIFDTVFLRSRRTASKEQPYSVSGTTIRTLLNPSGPDLPAAADAETLLYSAWGKQGNAQIGRWAAIWLTGEWHGAEIGMAAAEVEQKLGHQRLATVLSDPPSELSSLDDQNLLGAAWISEVAEFGGVEAVRELYSAKMPHPSVAEVTKALGTTPLELERKWQLWMYAYLAGMPPMHGGAGMPMNMPMPGGH